ncbi:unnamed protein product [Brassica napus]|uniref:(rape) hypothetical protein n=1 Tax=Brassica napus TaxID=3708 RepID=A0A816ZXB2_BRANA|nr:unnamed protein product [Brassica napus]
MKRRLIPFLSKRSSLSIEKIENFHKPIGILICQRRKEIGFKINTTKSSKAKRYRQREFIKFNLKADKRREYEEHTSLGLKTQTEIANAKEKSVKDQTILHQKR